MYTVDSNTEYKGTHMITDMRTHTSSSNGSVSMVNLLVWHLLPPVWWGLPWRCSALTVCVCVCVHLCALCVCFPFSSDVFYMSWCICDCVWLYGFKKCCASCVFLCLGSFVSMRLSICVSVGLYFSCASVCVFSFYVLVGPVQGAPSVWAHVRPAVGRPPGRLWQWEDPGVLWSQHS